MQSCNLDSNIESKGMFEGSNLTKPPKWHKEKWRDSKYFENLLKNIEIVDSVEAKKDASPFATQIAY